MLIKFTGTDFLYPYLFSVKIEDYQCLKLVTHNKTITRKLCYLKQWNFFFINCTFFCVIPLNMNLSMTSQWIVVSGLTVYCSRFFSLFVSVSSRSLWIAAICLFLSLMAWSRDFSSFFIHLSLSSLEVNWLPRPCLAYKSVLSCVAWASLELNNSSNEASNSYLKTQQIICV